MTLKAKSVALVAAVFLLVLGTSYAMFGWLERDVLAGLGTVYARKQVAYSRARTLHPLMRELALARKLADSPVLADWARHETDPARRIVGLRELEAYRRFFADRSYFFVVGASGHYYFNDRGNRYAGTELRYTLDPADPEDRWYYATLESGEPFRLNVDYDEKLRVTKVWINVVVRDGEEALGVVGTGIDLSRFLREAVAEDEEGVTNFFIEESGAIQAHDRVELIDFRTISKVPAERKTIFRLLDREDGRRFGEAMTRLKDAPDGATEVLFADLNGQRHLIGLARIPQIGWYAVTLLDAGRLIGSRRFLPFALLLLGALVALSAALVLMLDRFVLGRIGRLDRAVRDFARGTPPLPVPAARDEVGRLEHGFEQMARAVREHTEELEHKVAERTRELAEKNASLERALAEIRTLSGLLPTCMYCKKIRDEDDRWQHMEAYIGQRSEARFSHGICPECMEKVQAEAEA